MKIPFVAAIVLNVNHQRSSMVDLILDKFTLRTQATVEAGEWRSFKLLLRFFACTTPMFEDDGIFNILEELFNRAADLQTASSEDVSLAWN